MSQKVIGFGMMAALVAAFAGACATGTVGDTRDGGIRNDAGSSKDGSTTLKDSSPPPPKDSSTPIQDGTTCNFTVCGNLCVDTTQDDSNCGQCNNVCPTGSSCTNSQCACTGGTTLCSTSCVDTMTDNNNCGSCNHVCATSTTCTSGTCQAQTSSPPQGTCAHDLCTASSGPLAMGCDPTGCVTNVCTNDSYCCDTDWDSLCTSEVATYCPPYSCP
jgi:hypothetical protein